MVVVICEVGLDFEKVNVNGGVIVLGYLLGVMGVKLTAMLLSELEWCDGCYGIVIMCIGGGMGVVGLFEWVV